MLRAFTLALLALSLTLVTLAAANAESPKKRLLLLGQSPDGHPKGTHEYVPGVNVMAKCLADVPGLEVSVVNTDNPWTVGPELLAEADGAVLFLSEGAKWIQEEPRRLEAFGRLAARAGGLVTLHWAMGTREAKNIDAYLKLLGGCHGGPDRKYKVVEKASVRIADAEHPIVRGIKPFDVREEFYYRLKFVNAKTAIEPILQTEIDGNLETVCWAWQRPDGGRSFGFSGGHFHDNWQRAEYRRLMAQGILWTLKLEIPADGLNVKVNEGDLKLPE